MKTLIIGAGAIGCLVGGKLVHSGLPVTLVGREGFADAVDARGLQIEDEHGLHRLVDVAAADSIKAAYQIAEHGYDIAILTVKSYDTAAAIAELTDELERCGASTPLVLSLQNGVGNEELIADSLGEENVAAGVIMTPVSMLGQAYIRVDKPQYALGLSRWHTVGTDERFSQLRRMLADAGFDVTDYPDARGMKWTKLLMNMVGNATSAILDEPPDESFRDSSIIDLEIEAWREALSVMAALDVEPVDLGSFPFTKLAPLIRRTPKPLMRPVLRRQVVGARGGKMPSLHIDLYSDKGKSEIEWLNGAVVTHGRTAGTPTPVNQALVQALTCIIHDSGKRDLWRRNGLRLMLSAEDFKERQQ